MGGTLAGLGRTVAQFSQGMDNARRNSQGRKAQTLWKNSMLSFGNSLDMDTDYQTFEKRFNDHVTETQKQILDQIGHSGARQDFAQYAAMQLPIEKARIKHRANLLEIKFMKGEYFEQLEHAILREDKQFIEESTTSAIKDGYLDPTVGEKAKQAALSRVDYTTAWNDIINVESRDEALEIVKDTGLSPSEKNALISAWEKEQVAKEAKKAEELEEKQEEARKLILPGIRLGTVTASEIEASALDANEIYLWQERLYKRNQRVAAGKENPMNIVDPAVDFDMMRLVFSNSPPSEAEILMKVGVGLNIGRAEHWITQINKPDQGYSRALDYLKSQITPRQSLLKGESSPDARRYWNAVLELDRLIEEGEKSGKFLRGNDLLQKAIQIAPAFQLSITERAEEMAESFGTFGEEEEEDFWDTVGSFFKRDEKNKGKETYTDAEIRAILRANDIETTRPNVKLFRKQNEK